MYMRSVNGQRDFVEPTEPNRRHTQLLEFSLNQVEDTHSYWSFP